MPLRFWSPARFLCLAALPWACSPSTEPPQQLNPVTIRALQLVLLDPALGTRGVALEFTAEDSGLVTSFDVYRSLHPDSLGSPALANLDPKLNRVLLSVPDTNPPYTLYFGVRAVKRLETGEKLFSDSIPIDSLEVLPPVRVYRPANNENLLGIRLPVEVGVGSDQGILLRQSWWEKIDTGWVMRLDTCLPLEDCQTPLFGNVIQRDSVTLSHRGGASIPTLFCVLGSEVFDGRSTAQKQSLSCTRFLRQAQ